MHLDLDGQGPQYLQLSRAIRHAVQQGRIAGGSRLPATRELAQTLGLARNTVRAAYEHLSTVGLLHGRVGAGSFIAHSVPAPPPASAPPATMNQQARRAAPSASSGVTAR